MINYSDFYENNTISIRDEVHKFLYGHNDFPAQGMIAVLQNCLRDENDRPIPSGYRYKIANETTKQNIYYATTISGYLCTEKIIRCLIEPYVRYIDIKIGPLGLVPLERNHLLLSYQDPVKMHDVLIIPKFDVEGRLIMPVTPVQQYLITNVLTKVGDDGRIEYYEATIEIMD